MSDMNSVIEPDSTQVNADDFLAGPQTFTITGVKVRGGKEQPVEISLSETDKFYRPCKSMCRAMVAAWGPDSAKYAGRSLTLYCDQSIKWGGLAVGGIRISHMSDIESSLTMALTASRGSKKPFTVKPLQVEAAKNWPQELQNAATLDALGAVWKAIPASDKPKYLLIKDQRKEKLTPGAAQSGPEAAQRDPNADFAAEYDQAERGER